MPKIVRKKNETLTVETALAAFQEQFGDKYKIYKTALIGRDIVIRKSGWTGVAVKIAQKPDKTMIVFNAFSPSAGVRMLMLGLIPLLILWAVSWKQMQKEVQDFIESSPAFQ